MSDDKVMPSPTVPAFQAMVTSADYQKFFSTVAEAEAVASELECHGSAATLHEFNGSLPRTFDGRPAGMIRAACPLWGRVSCPYEGGNLVCDRGWKCVVSGSEKVSTNTKPLQFVVGPGKV